MTDSDEKPKDLLSTLIRSARQQIDKGSGWIEMPLHEHLQFLEYVSRLLDTTRSERDAALARVDLAVKTMEEQRRRLQRFGKSTEELDYALNALTPPAYPPEQPL